MGDSNKREGIGTAILAGSGSLASVTCLRWGGRAQTPGPTQRVKNGTTLTFPEGWGDVASELREKPSARGNDQKTSARETYQQKGGKRTKRVRTISARERGQVGGPGTLKTRPQRGICFGVGVSKKRQSVDGCLESRRNGNPGVQRSLLVKEQTGR